jgi:hypothetical protein
LKKRPDLALYRLRPDHVTIPLELWTIEWKGCRLETVAAIGAALRGRA